ncbi:3003_t:CDS:10 [Ambispora gerdemannii]|uniref:3003_t:CDS:1 n=1 Tax=Ambispora gerdemannii TaxID=144530 RepID=A0A9N9BCZ8_9GLOM|nr:3003_t:CDS:10 [Ambispora gerdemannii]
MAASKEIVEFEKILYSLLERKPPGTSASKIKELTRIAMTSPKEYKNIVQSVQKFIQRSAPDYKLGGLYVLDSISQAASRQKATVKDSSSSWSGAEYLERFEKLLDEIFQNIMVCPNSDKLLLFICEWRFDTPFEESPEFVRWETAIKPKAAKHYIDHASFGDNQQLFHVDNGGFDTWSINFMEKVHRVIDIWLKKGGIYKSEVLTIIKEKYFSSASAPVSSSPSIPLAADPVSGVPFASPAPHPYPNMNGAPMQMPPPQIQQLAPPQSHPATPAQVPPQIFAQPPKNNGNGNNNATPSKPGLDHHSPAAATATQFDKMDLDSSDVNHNNGLNDTNANVTSVNAHQFHPEQPPPQFTNTNHFFQPQQPNIGQPQQINGADITSGPQQPSWGPPPVGQQQQNLGVPPPSDQQQHGPPPQFSGFPPQWNPNAPPPQMNGAPPFLPPSTGAHQIPPPHVHSTPPGQLPQLGHASSDLHGMPPPQQIAPLSIHHGPSQGHPDMYLGPPPPHGGHLDMNLGPQPHGPPPAQGHLDMHFRPPTGPGPQIPPPIDENTYLAYEDPTIPKDSIRVLSRTLYVGGVTPSMKYEDIEAIFLIHGKVSSVTINHDKHNAFVKMGNRGAAMRTIMESGNILKTTKLEVRWGVGFGPKECYNFKTGESVIPLARLTETDKRWLKTSEVGGTGGRELIGGVAIEEPNIVIGEGPSSGSTNNPKRAFNAHFDDHSPHHSRGGGGGHSYESVESANNRDVGNSGNGGRLDERPYNTMSSNNNNSRKFSDASWEGSNNQQDQNRSWTNEQDDYHQQQQRSSPPDSNQQPQFQFSPQNAKLPFNNTTNESPLRPTLFHTPNTTTTTPTSPPPASLLLESWYNNSQSVGQIESPDLLMLNKQQLQQENYIPNNNNEHFRGFGEDAHVLAATGGGGSTRRRTRWDRQSK